MSTTVLHGDVHGSHHAHEARDRLTDRTRLTLIRGVAAAFLLSGVIGFIAILTNVVLRIGYTGGLLGLWHLDSVFLASCLNSLCVLPDMPAPKYWALFAVRSRWIVHQAEADQRFYALAVSVQATFSIGCAILAFGLWRRLNWARLCAFALTSVLGIFAISTAILMVWINRGYRWSGFGLIATVAVVLGILFAILAPSRTATLFTPEGRRVRFAPASRRRWWTMAFQWMLALLSLVLAAGILALYTRGPLVEIIWALAWMTAQPPP
jgi:hypothetical protein